MIGTKLGRLTYALKRDAHLSTPHVSARMRQIIRERDNLTCQYCGIEGRSNELIIEHVIPAVRDGVAKPYNLVVACQSCNSTKGSKVWIPRNLDDITKAYPEWKNLVLKMADSQQPVRLF
jgi:5-methylcytosine-specific restriction endonuclease McrA